MRRPGRKNVANTVGQHCFHVCVNRFGSNIHRSEAVALNNVLAQGGKHGDQIATRWRQNGATFGVPDFWVFLKTWLHRSGFQLFWNTWPRWRPDGATFGPRSVPNPRRYRREFPETRGQDGHESNLVISLAPTNFFLKIYMCIGMYAFRCVFIYAYTL